MEGKYVLTESKPINDAHPFYYRDSARFGDETHGPVMLYSECYAFIGFIGINEEPIKYLYNTRELRCTHRIGIDNPHPYYYVEDVGNIYSISDGKMHMMKATANNVDYIWRFKGGKPTYSFVIQNHTILNCAVILLRIVCWIILLIPVVYIVGIFIVSNEYYGSNENAKSLVSSQWIKLKINVVISLLFGGIIIYLASKNDISDFKADYKMNRYLCKHYEWMYGLNSNLSDQIKEYTDVIIEFVKEMIRLGLREVIRLIVPIIALKIGEFIKRFKALPLYVAIVSILIGFNALLCLLFLMVECIFAVLFIAFLEYIWAHEAKFVINDLHVFEDDIKYFIIDALKSKKDGDGKDILDQMDTILFNGKKSQYILYSVFNQVMISILLMQMKSTFFNECDYAKNLLIDLKNTFDNSLNAMLNGNTKDVCNHNFNNIDICTKEYNIYKKLKLNELYIWLSIYFMIISVVNVSIMYYRTDNIVYSSGYIFAYAFCIISCLFNMIAVYKMELNYFNKITKDHLFFMDPQIINIIGKLDMKWNDLVVTILCENSSTIITTIFHFMITKQTIKYLLSNKDIPTEISNIIISYITPNISDHQLMIDKSNNKYDINSIKKNIKQLTNLLSSIINEYKKICVN